MSRDRYLVEQKREKEQAQALSAESATGEAFAVLNHSRQQSAEQKRLKEIQERLARGETIHVRQPEKNMPDGRQEIIDSQARPFESDFRRKRPLWKRLFGRG